MLLVDLDPQFNATQYMMDYQAFQKHREEGGTIADLLVDPPTLDPRLKKVGDEEPGANGLTPGEVASGIFGTITTRLHRLCSYGFRANDDGFDGFGLSFDSDAP